MNIARKITAIVLIASGIGIIAFPWGKAWYFNRIQNKVMRLWIEAAESFKSSAYEESVYLRENQAAGKNTAAGIIDENIETDGGVWVENTEPVFDLDYIQNNMEGIISIEKIKLRAPILKNATSYNLNISICSVAGSGKMGQPGNYVLAGHRSRIRSRHFNRLNELSPGDKVVVEDGTTFYEYFVTEVLYVTPDETWVMENDGDKALLTLITCDYGTNPTGRLVVKCEVAV